MHFNALHRGIKRGVALIEGFVFDITVLQAEWGAITEGFFRTVFITFFSCVIALLLSVMMTFFRTLDKPFIEIILDTFTALFRNVPILILLYFLYKGLPGFGIILPPITCGIIGLSLYGSAYFAEVFQSGLSSISLLQTQSAAALGLGPWERFLHVLLPQIARLTIPSATNIAVNICKNSALLAFITVNDLFYVVYKGGVTFFHYMEFFTLGLVTYLILNYLITLIFKLVEIVLYNNYPLWITAFFAKRYQSGELVYAVHTAHLG